MLSVPSSEFFAWQAVNALSLSCKKIVAGRLSFCGGIFRYNRQVPSNEKEHAPPLASLPHSVHLLAVAAATRFSVKMVQALLLSTIRPAKVVPPSFENPLRPSQL
jgi:hypothetical protein